MKLIAGASTGKLKAIDPGSSQLSAIIEQDRQKKQQIEQQRIRQERIAVAQENARLAQEAADRAGSATGIALETGKGVGKTLLEMGKATARLPFTVPMKTMLTLKEGFTGQPQSYNPTTGVEKFLYGDQPVESYTGDQRAIQAWGQEKGLSRGASIGLGALGAGGEAVLDLATPGVGQLLGKTFIGKALSRFAGGEAKGLNAIEIKEAVDAITEKTGVTISPSDKTEIINAMAHGATKDDVVKAVDEAVNAPAGAALPEDADAAFLKSIEDRFNASKTTKFRESTPVDAEKDQLSEALENRIQNIKGESIEEFSLREDLRALQEKVVKAKKAELPNLKAESDRLIDELLDQRAGNFRPLVEADKREAALASIAKDADSVEDYMVRLKKGGINYHNEFKSLPELKQFFRTHSDTEAKFRTEEVIPKSLADETEAGYQVRAEMETANAGSREFIDSGIDQRVIGIPSTFPKWVSPEYRSKELFEKVLDHIEKGSIPTSTRQIGLYREVKEEMIRRANSFGERFEKLTGKKITPEEEKKIRNINKKLFGDENIEITAQLMTPSGQKAFGQYKNRMIKILDGQVNPTDTYYHEAVHKYLDLFTTLDEQKQIYVEARNLWKTDNLDELEELIAENFIRYAKTNEGVIGTLKVLFDKVIDRIKAAVKGESAIESLYNDILVGKATKKAEVKATPKTTPKKTTTPKKESGYAKSLEAKAIEKEMADAFEDVAEYTPAVRKEQAELTAKLLNEDIDKVRRILDGTEELPSNIRGSSLALAVEKFALKHNDVDLIKRLANSKIATDISEAGSELSMLVGRNADSPVKIIQSINKVRKETLKKRLKGGSVAEAKKKAKDALKKSIKKAEPTKETWVGFINEIQC